ncbi:MAG: LysR family transcriptional regulator [Alphaproteobacteria bacterium]
MHDLSQLRNINVRQMLDLLAIVEHGGVTAAAKTLNVSQPALTRSIRQLEENLDVELLAREGRGVVPTRFGVSLAEHARTIEAELRHATRNLSDLRTAEAGHLVIGASPIGLATLVGPTLSRLHDEIPGLTVEVRNDPFEIQLDDLDNGKIDIVIGALWGGQIHEHLVEEVLFQNSLSVVLRSDHPLTRKRNLKFSDLSEETWIIARGSAAIRQLVANEFRFEGSELPVFTIETDSMLCVKSLLLASDFISANPAELFATEIDRGVLSVLPLQWHSGTRPIGFTLREHGTITPALAALIEILRDVGREIAAEQLNPRRRRSPVSRPSSRAGRNRRR